MARTIAEIQAQIITEKGNNPELKSLNSDSKTAIWRVWTYVTATAIWTLETLFELHKKEVDDLILSKKPHNLRWYRAKARAFQFGKELMPESDRYDNSGASADEIAKSRIIKHVAVEENRKMGWVRIKAAKETNGELQALSRVSPDELTPFKRYMHLIKDAGVKLVVDSLPPDRLKMDINIYYDPLVLDGNGGRLDDATIKPVNNTIQAYLQNLPFNGEFVLATLTDRLQQTAGVIIPQIVRASATYGNREDQLIDVRYEPDAGYLRIDNKDLTINYIAPDYKD
ncbi:MAG: nucleotidyltransferase [Pedobacter sp.]|nr:MAG: nucleotidyltransferase [Pedobacter sp.]